MTIFSILLFLALVSCSKENDRTLTDLNILNQLTEFRTVVCPTPLFTIQHVYNGDPCADVKLIYSGTNVDPTICTFDELEVKIFKTKLQSETKTFNSSLDPQNGTLST